MRYLICIILHALFSFTRPIVSFRKRIVVTYNIKQFTRCIFYWFWKIASWIKYTLHLPFCTSCKVVAGVKLWNHYKRQLVWRHDLSLNLHTHTYIPVQAYAHAFKKSNANFALYNNAYSSALRQVEFHLSARWFVTAV